MKGVMHYSTRIAAGKINYPDKKIADEWKHNLEEGNYISYRRNPRAYYNQPVERDAREFAETRYAATDFRKGKHEKF